MNQPTPEQKRAIVKFLKETSAPRLIQKRLKEKQKEAV